MARNDGIDRTSVRNLAVSDKAVGNTQQHNEREKDSYRNPDIIPQRTAWNIHFKKPTASYTDLFSQLETAGTISTRGLKPDATHYCELVFDVNSAYFDNHGGYEFAKQFYEDAYQAAVQIVGGEQYILSAVMHADEINRAMTEALGREVYHYHLHVVYVPVVEKQILWSKRCKDKALVGTVKETVMQVSRSKKWASKPLLDDAGKPVLQKSGKPVLKKSYSVLQDDFFHYMRNAGYTDVERGERGSTEEHLTVTQFKLISAVFGVDVPHELNVLIPHTNRPYQKGAACGNIWQSNINICGTPNGYYVYSFVGTSIIIPKQPIFRTASIRPSIRNGGGICREKFGF